MGKETEPGPHFSRPGESQGGQLPERAAVADFLPWLRRVFRFKREETHRIDPLRYHVERPPEEHVADQPLTLVDKILFWIPWTGRWLVRDSERDVRASVDLFIRSMHLSPGGQSDPPEDTASQGKR